MKRRVWSIFFLSCFLVVIGSVLAVKILALSGVDFPEWTKIGEERSYLEGRKYESFPDLSLDAVESGAFQDSFEQYVSDLVPFRDDALLLNAAVQRDLISVANSIFKYDVYPTFYGSGYVYSPEHDALYQTLDPAEEETDESFEDAASAYEEFANRHPDKTMVFYRVDRMSSSSNNPTNCYISNPVNTEYLSEHFFDLLGNGICVVDGTLESEEEALGDLFRTDHHWQNGYAYQAYCSILREFDPEADPVSYELIKWELPAFYGSLARSGLCTTSSPDYIEDYYVDMSNIDVTVDGKKKEASFLDHREQYGKDEWGADLFTNRYGEYFHGDYGLITIENAEAESDDVLLIVGDSFSNNMERFFASHYKKVLVYDARYAEESIENTVDMSSVDDILFMLGSTNMASDDSIDALREG